MPFAPAIIAMFAVAYQTAQAACNDERQACDESHGDAAVHLQTNVAGSNADLALAYPKECNFNVTATPDTYGETKAFKLNLPCSANLTVKKKAHTWCKKDHDTDAMILVWGTQSKGFLSCSNQSWTIKASSTVVSKASSLTQRAVISSHLSSGQKDTRALLSKRQTAHKVTSAPCTNKFDCSYYGSDCLSWGCSCWFDSTDCGNKLSCEAPGVKWYDFLNDNALGEEIKKIWGGSEPRFCYNTVKGLVAADIAVVALAGIAILVAAPEIVGGAVEAGGETAAEITAEDVADWYDAAEAAEELEFAEFEEGALEEEEEFAQEEAKVGNFFDTMKSLLSNNVLNYVFGSGSDGVLDFASEALDDDGVLEKDLALIIGGL